MTLTAPVLTHAPIYSQSLGSKNCLSTVPWNWNHKVGGRCDAFETIENDTWQSMLLLCMLRALVGNVSLQNSCNSCLQNSSTKMWQSLCQSVHLNSLATINAIHRINARYPTVWRKFCCKYPVCFSSRIPWSAAIARNRISGALNTNFSDHIGEATVDSKTSYIMYSKYIICIQPVMATCSCPCEKHVMT